PCVGELRRVGPQLVEDLPLAVTRSRLQLAGRLPRHLGVIRRAQTEGLKRAIYGVGIAGWSRGRCLRLGDQHRGAERAGQRRAQPAAQAPPPARTWAASWSRSKLSLRILRSKYSSTRQRYRTGVMAAEPRVLAVTTIEPRTSGETNGTTAARGRVTAPRIEFITPCI